MWVPIARRVRSWRPTLRTTTGFPASAARSSAATYRSGSAIHSVNVAMTLVSGSSTSASMYCAVLTTASLPDEMTWLQPNRRTSASMPMQIEPLCDTSATLPARPAGSRTSCM